MIWLIGSPWTQSHKLFAVASTHPNSQMVREKHLTFPSSRALQNSQLRGLQFFPASPHAKHLLGLRSCFCKARGLAGGPAPSPGTEPERFGASADHGLVIFASLELRRGYDRSCCHFFSFLVPYPETIMVTQMAWASVALIHQR